MRLAEILKGSQGGHGGRAVRGSILPSLPSLAVLAVCFPGALSAQSAPDAGTVVDQAIAAYADVRTLRADFTQTLTDPMIGTDQTTRGEFMQQRPNRFSMRWRQPAGDLILSDGEYLWVYLPSAAPQQVVRSAVSREPGQTPDVVADFLTNPRERFTITYERAEAVGGRAADVLRFVPLTRNVPYRRVLIWIDRRDHLPRRVELTEASGAVRRVTLDRLRVNATLPGSAFTFRPPSGVRVVDTSY